MTPENGTDDTRSGRSLRAAVQVDVRYARAIALVAAAALMAAGLSGAQLAVRWLIIVDDLHVDFRNTGQVRTLLKAIAAGLIRDGDHVALYSTGPSSISVEWTRDRGAVDSVARQIAGNSLKVSDIVAITQGLTPTDEVGQRATLALSRVDEIMASVDPTIDRWIGDRWIGIIFISSGYVDRVPSLPRAGGRARIPIFAIDPRLLPGATVDRAGVNADRWNAYWAATRDSLRALSEQSGGFALAEGDDLAATLARIRDRVIG